MATLQERAAELKAVLDSVHTCAEAQSVAAATVERGQRGIDLLGGFTSAGVRELLAGDISRVQAAAAALPGDETAVLSAGDAWSGPQGLRRAIQALAATVWAQERVFPVGTSAGDDWSIFLDGFSSTLRSELSTVGDVVKQAADVTGGLLWPVAIGLASLAGLFLAVKFGGLKTGAA